jgi:hypothetical protein
VPGWRRLLIAALALGCRAPAPRVAVPDDPDAAPIPTAIDVRVVQRAEVLLADPSAWRHAGDRDCAPEATSWNLYCVLERASLDVTGGFEHRSAALQEVRWVVDERTRGIELQHRLMDFNNLPTTSFADIKSVLAEAQRRLVAKVGASR